MAELKTISAALKLIDAKKENLRKAFENLEAHSSSLSSFTLSWSAIDAHFSSIQSSLNRQFEVLQSRTESISQNDILPVRSAVSLPSQNNSGSSQSRLRLICSAMDVEALLRYIMDYPDNRTTMGSELLEAFQAAPDPAKMVLDAVTGFFPCNDDKDKSDEQFAMKRSCLFMLEQLMLFSPDIGEDVRQRAKNLANKWEKKVKVRDNTIEPLDFLRLIAAFGLGSEYDSNELVDLLIGTAGHPVVLSLFRALNLVDKVPDLIQRLIDSGRRFHAVKIVVEFKLTHKFPLVPILKSLAQSVMDDARKVREDGKQPVKSVVEATNKEIRSLKLVQKYIKNYDLDKEYPSATLEKHIQELKSEMAAIRKAAQKCNVVIPALKPIQQQQKKKRKIKPAQDTAQARPSVPSGAAAPFQQPVPYMNQPAGVYGFARAAPVGFLGNHGPLMPHLHPMEPHPPMHSGHGGFGLQSMYPPPNFRQ